jgi:hypothetical protein
MIQLVMPARASNGRGVTFVAGIYSGRTLVATTLQHANRNDAARAGVALRALIG